VTFSNEVCSTFTAMSSRTLLSVGKMLDFIAHIIATRILFGMNVHVYCSVAFIANLVLIVKLCASDYIVRDFDFAKILVAHKPK